MYFWLRAWLCFRYLVKYLTACFTLGAIIWMGGVSTVSLDLLWFSLIIDVSIIPSSLIFHFFFFFLLLYGVLGCIWLTFPRF